MIISMTLPYNARYQKVAGAHLWFFYKQLQDFSDQLDHIVFIGFEKNYLSPADLPEMCWEKSPRVLSDLEYSIPSGEVWKKANIIAVDQTIFKPLEDEFKSNNLVWTYLMTKEYGPFMDYLRKIFIRINEKEPLEAVLLNCNNPSVKAVCRELGIPVIHSEIGPTRKPLYFQSAYWDLSGVNGNTEAARRFDAAKENLKKSDLSKRALQALFMEKNHFFQVESLLDTSEFKVGVAGQVDDDSNILAYSNGFTCLELTKYANFHFGEENVLFRSHPGAQSHFKAQLDQSDTPAVFFKKIDSLITINSSMALEGCLFNKPVMVVGDSPFKILSDDLVNGDIAADGHISELNFLMLNYIIPYEFMFDYGYLKWRLSMPSEEEIRARHLAFYLNKHGARSIEELIAQSSSRVVCQENTVSAELPSEPQSVMEWNEQSWEALPFDFSAPSEYTVSFLVSVQNGEKTLAKCLDSIIAQGGNNFEIIAVDDCSTDSTSEILREYQQKYSALKILTNTQRRGLVYNRRKLIACASGRYIHFVDADDYLKEGCLDTLKSVAAEKEYDIIAFNIETVDSDGHVIEFAELAKLFNCEKEETLSGNRIFENFFVRKNHLFGIWNKWIRRELFSKIDRFFSDRFFGVMAEDFYIMFLVSLFAESQKSLNKVFYQYSVGAGISTRQVYSFAEHQENIYSVSVILKKVQAVLEEIGRFQQYKADFFHWSKELLTNTVQHLFVSLQPEERAINTAFLRQHLPAELLIPVLSDYYREFSRDILPECCKKIRTVCLYYYRLNNGGIERVLSSLMPIYLKMGLRVVLLTDDPLSPESYPVPEGVVHRFFPENCGCKNGRIDRHERIVNWQKIIREENIDAVIYNAYIEPLCIDDLLAVKFCDSHFAVITHNVSWYPVVSDGASAVPKAYSMADALICISRSDAAWWKNMGCNARYIPNPLSWSCKEISDFSPRNHDILWVGRISSEKRPLDALKAFQLVAEKVPDARLFIVGKAEENDPLMTEVTDFVRRNGLSEKVVFAGYTLAVEKYLSSAAVHLHTSEYEGCPLTILESKSFGVPIVAYDLPNIEPFRQGGGHLTVPQRDWKTLAEKVIQVLLDSDLRAELGKKSYQSLRYFTDYPFEEEWNRIFTALEKCELQDPEEVSPEDLSIAVKLFQTDGLYAMNEKGQFLYLKKELAHFKQAYEFNAKAAAELSEKLESEVLHYKKIIEEKLQELADYRKALSYNESEVSHYQKIVEEKCQELADCCRALSYNESEVQRLTEKLQSEVKYYQEGFAYHESEIARLAGVLEHCEQNLEQEKKEKEFLEEKLAHFPFRIARKADDFFAAVKCKINALLKR